LHHSKNFDQNIHRHSTDWTTAEKFHGERSDAAAGSETEKDDADDDDGDDDADDDDDSDEEMADANASSECPCILLINNSHSNHFFCWQQVVTAGQCQRRENRHTKVKEGGEDS
jgi:hypothetical protein